MPETWYRLDNAARAFAAIASRRNTTVFRVAATLSAPVDRAVLQEALAAVMPRFPYFGVRLRAGLFWHYLERIPGAPAVRVECSAPCRRFVRADDGPWQLRVLVFERRIAVECSHVLSDGSGALGFLVALLAEYLRRRGIDIPADPRIMRPGEPPDPGESEDGYRRFYHRDIPRPRSSVRAHRLHGDPLPPDDLRVVLGVVPLAPLRAASAAHGVTLTEYLVSTLLLACLDVAPEARRPLVVMTPVNLRTLFASPTMRNFFLSVSASIDPRLGTYSFEEIVRQVHHAIQGQVTAKNVSGQIRRHVGAERNAFIRHIPLLLKVPAKRRLYARRWGSRYTTVLSNLGRAPLPESMSEHVERVEAILNPSTAHGIGCAVVGWGDCLSINFSSIVSGTGLERAFFTRLRRMGNAARIETNRGPEGT